MWFQHNGCFAQFSEHVFQFLNELFSNRWICWGDFVHCPTQFRHPQNMSVFKLLIFHYKYIKLMQGRALQYYITADYEVIYNCSLSVILNTKRNFEFNEYFKVQGNNKNSMSCCSALDCSRSKKLRQYCRRTLMNKDEPPIVQWASEFQRPSP